MTTDTTTPTTDAEPVAPSEPTAIDKARALVTEATASLAAAEKEAEPIVAKIMTTKPINFVALGKATEAVEAATKHLEAVSAALKIEETKGYWDRADEVRKPILELLRSTLVETPPVSPLVSVSGLITIDPDGNAEITLKGVFETPDLKDIEAMIAAVINGPAFAAEGIDSIDVNITKVSEKAEGSGHSLATISLMPTAAVAQAARVKVAGASTSRAGDKVYTYKEKAYNARGFLEALEAEKHQIAIDRAKGFETALRVAPFNGQSNLAQSVAKAVGATVSDKPVAVK